MQHQNISLECRKSHQVNKFEPHDGNSFGETNEMQIVTRLIESDLTDSEQLQHFYLDKIVGSTIKDNVSDKTQQVKHTSEGSAGKNEQPQNSADQRDDTSRETIEEDNEDGPKEVKLTENTDEIQTTPQIDQSIQDISSEVGLDNTLSSKASHGNQDEGQKNSRWNDNFRKENVFQHLSDTPSFSPQYTDSIRFDGLNISAKNNTTQSHTVEFMNPTDRSGNINHTISLGLQQSSFECSKPLITEHVHFQNRSSYSATAFLHRNAEQNAILLAQQQKMKAAIGGMTANGSQMHEMYV